MRRLHFSAGRRRSMASLRSALCTKCKIVKPISEFEIVTPLNYQWGVARHCNECKLNTKITKRANKRLEIIRKLGGKCCLCGAVSCLQVHHTIPKRKHGYVMVQPDFTPESLKEVVCLCYDCHLHEAHEGSFSKGGNILDLPANVPRLILNE